MKKALAIAGILALSITPTASFADHLEPKNSEIRPGGNLAHTNLRGRNLSNANLTGANLDRAFVDNANLSGANLMGTDLSSADLTGITATNLRDCPLSFLPSGWVCENNSLIQR